MKIKYTWYYLEVMTYDLEKELTKVFTKNKNKRNREVMCGYVGDCVIKNTIIIRVFETMTIGRRDYLIRYKNKSNKKSQRRY